MDHKAIYKQVFPAKSKLVIASGDAPNFGSPLGNIPLSSHSTCALHVIMCEVRPTAATRSMAMGSIENGSTAPIQ